MASAGSKRRWSFAAIVALAVVGGGALLFRSPVQTPPPRSAPASPPPIQMARPSEADLVLKDEALIRDLRPLFLPTDFNASLAEPRREPGRTILDEERPRLEFAETELGIGRDLPPFATLNGLPLDRVHAADALATRAGEVGLVGLGRHGRVVEPLAPRGGFVEVVAVATGGRVLAESLPLALGPVGGKEWEPMELFAAVDAAGLAAPLIVTEGSRVEEVDAHFRKILASSFRIGDRLPPGFYRIVVGP